MGIKYLYYYALGKFDCAIGNEALEGQSEAYYDGYNDQYQNEQNQGAEEWKHQNQLTSWQQLYARRKAIWVGQLKIHLTRSLNQAMLT